MIDPLLYEKTLLKKYPKVWFGAYYGKTWEDLPYSVLEFYSKRLNGLVKKIADAQLKLSITPWKNI